MVPVPHLLIEMLNFIGLEDHHLFIENLFQINRLVHKVVQLTLFLPCLPSRPHKLGLWRNLLSPHRQLPLTDISDVKIVREVQ